MKSIATVTTTSPAQADAWSAGRNPAPEQIADGVWAIASPIPEGTLPHTLTYVLRGRDGSVHLVDPGWDSDENLATLTASLERLGCRLGDVSTVIATHFHPDHLGLAGRLRELSGASVLFSGVERRVLAQDTSALARDRRRYAGVLDEWGVPAVRRSELIDSFDRPSLVDDLEPDRALADGETIDLPGHTLRVIATPGHTDGHICLADDERRLLYSGDHVLPTIYSGIGIGSLPESDALGDYFDSIAKLEPVDEYETLPGHEYRFEGLAARRAEIAAHHRRRVREVAALADELGDESTWEYARRLTWTSGWDGLTGFWLHSALRQTQMHLRLVRSGRAESLLVRADGEERDS
ncbi:MBL fold metallo-hydrolase [Agromyces sp. NPDC058484]|uniref:MBL fold metallo-hydrolase n=1 Tax=Agromyces sp. NPDC058484 TaxID=3346524 RepID=UPI0036644AFC